MQVDLKLKQVLRKEHMAVTPGIKSASWQLVAVVVGAKNDAKRQNTTQNWQNQPKIKGKDRIISKDSFLVAVILEIFSRYDGCVNFSEL